MKSLLALLCLFCLTAPAFAEDAAERAPSSVPDAGMADKPSQAEIKKVVDYFNTGHDLVLVDRKVCKQMGKDAAKNDCLEEAANGEITKGEKSFLVPKEFKEGTVLIQYNQNGVTRNASQRSIAAKDGAMRYRVFNQVPTLNPGDYEVAILLDNHGTTTPLEKMTLKVNPKN